MCHASALRMGREGVETAASPVLAEVALIYRAAGACPRAPCRPRSAKDRLISWPLRALLFVTPPLALEQRLLVLLPHPVLSARVLPPAGRRGCVQEGSPSRRPPHSLAQAPGQTRGEASGRPQRCTWTHTGGSQRFPTLMPAPGSQNSQPARHSFSCHPLGPGGVVQLALSELMMKY